MEVLWHIIAGLLGIIVGIAVVTVLFYFLER